MICVLEAATGSPEFREQMEEATAVCFLADSEYSESTPTRIAFYLGDEPWAFMRKMERNGVCIHRGGGWRA